MRRGGAELSANLILGAMKHEVAEHIFARRAGAQAGAQAGAKAGAQAGAQAPGPAGGGSGGGAAPAATGECDAVVGRVLQRQLPELCPCGR